MERLNNIKDLERFHKPDNTSNPNYGNTLDYLIPMEWFVKFPELNEYGYTGLRAKLHWFSKNVEQFVRENKPKGQWVGFCIEPVDDLVLDDISRDVFFASDLFEDYPQLVHNPAIQKIESAILKHRGLKKDHVLVSIYSHRTMGPAITKEAKKYMAKLLMQMNSWTDIITNSSSEVFLCGADKDSKVLEKMILDFADTTADESWLETDVRPVNIEEQIKLAIKDDWEKDNVYDAFGDPIKDINLEDYDITPEVVKEIDRILRKVYHMAENTNMFTVLISERCSTTRNWLCQKFNAKHLFNC